MELAPDILRTFVAAAQTLNFTQAAKQVHLTRRNLEKYAGVPRFLMNSEISYG